MSAGCTHCGTWCVRGRPRAAIAQCAAILGDDRERAGRPLPKSGWYALTIDRVEVQARPVDRCRAVITVARRRMPAPAAAPSAPSKRGKGGKPAAASKSPQKRRTAPPRATTPAPAPRPASKVAERQESTVAALVALGVKPRDAEAAATAAAAEAPTSKVEDLVRMALTRVPKKPGAGGG